MASFVAAWALWPFSPQWKLAAILNFGSVASLGIHILLFVQYNPSLSFTAITGGSYLVCSRFISTVDAVAKSVDVGIMSLYNAAIMSVCTLVALFSFDHRVSIWANIFFVPSTWLMKSSNLDRGIAHRWTLDNSCQGELSLKANGANTYKRFLWSVNTCVWFAPRTNSPVCQMFGQRRMLLSRKLSNSSEPH